MKPSNIKQSMWSICTSSVLWEPAVEGVVRFLVVEDYQTEPTSTHSHSPLIIPVKAADVCPASPKFVFPMYTRRGRHTHARARALTRARTPLSRRVCLLLLSIHAYPFRSHCYYLSDAFWTTVPTSVCVQILENIRRFHMVSSFRYRGSPPVCHHRALLISQSFTRFYKVQGIK